MGVELPSKYLPLGRVQRASPTGPELLLVFAQEADRLEALVLLSRPRERPSDLPARAAGGGGLYHRVGVFVRVPGGSWSREGRWFKLWPGGIWGEGRPPAQAFRLCLPCAGWLCPEAPIACFSDFNDDGWEEAHLAGECGEQGCRLLVLEGSPEGARELFQGVVDRHSWRQHESGWALVPRPECGDRELCGASGRSLGKLGCRRPQVYRLGRGEHRMLPDAALRSRYYPLSYRNLPADCPPIRGTVEVWDPDAGFIRYR